jgi:N-acetylmuramoyl-L-alanine amidase
MPPGTPLRAIARTLVLVLAACAAPAGRLPAIPGPQFQPQLRSSTMHGVQPPAGNLEQQLAVRVVYPPSGAAIASSDSNFIFGSVSSPRARLIIDGTVVRVHPNGAFLAWLPVPPRDSQVYNIVASVPGDTAHVTHPVRIPGSRPVLSTSGALVVDSSSLVPRGPIMLRPDELVRVSVRAPRNASAFVTLGGVRYPLVNGGVLPAIPAGAAQLDSAAARSFADDPDRWSTSVPAQRLYQGGRVTVARGGDTVLLTLPRLQLVDSAGPMFGMLGVTPAPVSDTDRVVIARPSPGGTYKWLLSAGTVVRVTGREGDYYRVRFDTALEAWVPVADVAMMPTGFAPAPALPLNSRVVSAANWVDFIIPMGERTPYHIQTFHDRVELTLHGVRANLDNVTMPAGDTLVRSVTTAQETSDRARITLHMTQPPFGYQVLWERGSMVLRVRRPPRVIAGAPLRGLTIAVDAGHPPAGATGPTGLYEGVATLQIATRLKAALEARGAKVVMTRTTNDPLELAIRPVMARRADAHALVSIHLNALPDGINPFDANGTSTYYFHDISAPLAREVHTQMLRRLRYRDLGVMYNTFAVTRPTWMPSILCEGAFIMIPEQEAAARTAQFQSSYAVAVADGLQRYFATWAGRR